MIQTECGRYRRVVQSHRIPSELKTKQHKKGNKEMKHYEVEGFFRNLNNRNLGMWDKYDAWRDVEAESAEQAVAQCREWMHEESLKDVSADWNDDSQRMDFRARLLYENPFDGFLDIQEWEYFPGKNDTEEEE